MDCKKIEKKIPDFINENMDIYMLKDFINHIDNCSECREELSIQFLVAEGIIALETGETYDFQNSLEDRMAKARHQIHINKRLFWLRNFVFGLVIILFFVFVALIYKFL